MQDLVVLEFRDEDAWSQFLKLSVEGVADYSPGSPQKRKAMFPARSGATSTYDQGSPPPPPRAAREFLLKVSISQSQYSSPLSCNSPLVHCKLSTSCKC